MNRELQRRIFRGIITTALLAGYGISLYLQLTEGIEISLYLWAAIFFILGYYFHDEGFTFETPAFTLTNEDQDDDKSGQQ